MPYDEETRKLIENRKRNAELRKEKQLKKRKITLGALGALVVVLVVIIIIAASASSKSDSEVPTTKEPETTYINETTAEATEAVTTQEATTEASAQTMASETTKEPETTISDETKAKETTTSAPETTKKVATGKTLYTNDDVNIRRKPKEKGSNIIDIVDKGSKVQVLGTEKGWSHVVWNGIEGYISARFLTENK